MSITFNLYRNFDGTLDGRYPSGDKPSGGGLALYSPFNVEITQPQAGLTTANRFYKAYTGLEYKVKVCVRGGDFSALQYSLTSAPVGMTIDSSTGVITWPNPVEAGSPHTVSISVTDGLTSDTVSIPLTVTTNEFLFVDVNAANGGDGSIGSPFNSFEDFYLLTESDSTYQDHFVYFRAGTHFPNSSANTAGGGMQWGTQKPVVLLAYPNESVTFDMTSIFFFGDADCSNFYVDGINHTNVSQSPLGTSVFAYRVAGQNMSWVNNSFSGIADTVGANNQAYVMVPAGAARNNCAFVNNVCDGNSANAYATAVLYDTVNFVFEANTVTNVGNIAFGVKAGNTGCSIRGNISSGAGKHAWLYNEGGGSAHEVSWNYISSTDNDAYHVNQASIYLLTAPNYAIRNTFVGDCVYFSIEGTDAIQYEINNVVVSSQPNNRREGGDVDGSRISITDNLVNATTTSFIDIATGLLIDSFASQNDTRGHNGVAGAL